MTNNAEYTDVLNRKIKDEVTDVDDNLIFETYEIKEEIKEEHVENYNENNAPVKTGK